MRRGEGDCWYCYPEGGRGRNAEKEDIERKKMKKDIETMKKKKDIQMMMVMNTKKKKKKNIDGKMVRNIEGNNIQEKMLKSM